PIAGAQDAPGSDLPGKAGARTDVVVNRLRHERLVALERDVVVEGNRREPLAWEARILLRGLAVRNRIGADEVTLIWNVDRVRQGAVEGPGRQQNVVAHAPVDRQVGLQTPFVM